MDILESKDSLLRKKIIVFYSNDKNLNIFLNITLQKTIISLRILDWFVTNYSKKYNISYPININYSNYQNIQSDKQSDKQSDRNKYIDYYPYKGYKLHLKAYSKKYCDPFCRRERILFDYEKCILKDLSNNKENNTKNSIVTTLGQLNFFKFAIEYGIIDYVLNNIKDIEQDMNTTLKNRNIEKNFIQLKSIKRKELSKAANKGVNITIVNAIIKFI